MPAPDNKFARQAEQISKKNKGEDQANIDARLTRLEEDVRRLKIEYDIFFNGGSKRPPYDTKSRVETSIKRLADERSLTAVQRYQYNSIASRYSSFKELWRRTMQGREEGRDAVTLARAALSEQQASSGEEKTATAKSDKPIVFSFGSVESQTDVVQKIYEALIRAKQQCGEKTEEFSFGQFQQQFTAQTERLKEKTGCQKLSFEIGVEDGKVAFKARAERDE